MYKNRWFSMCYDISVYHMSYKCVIKFKRKFAIHDANEKNVELK